MYVVVVVVGVLLALLVIGRFVDRRTVANLLRLVVMLIGALLLIGVSVYRLAT